MTTSRISPLSSAQRLLALLLALATVSFVALTAFASPAFAGTGRMPANSGSGSGYSWSENQGPDQRDDSTNFGSGMKFKLQYSMSGIYNAETRMQNTVNSLNASGTGVPFQYGGRTSNTAVPTCHNCSNYENAFLVRIIPTSSMNTLGGSCTGTNVLACARPKTWGTTTDNVLNVQACIVYIDGDKYKSGQYGHWDGVFKHELMHCIGMQHFDGYYNNQQQLMKSVTTFSDQRSGDVNGIRALTRRI